MAKCKYYVREAAIADAHELAPHLKAADLAEIWASGHHTGLEALLLGFEYRYRNWAVVMNGQVAALFGVTAPSICSPVGTPWLLGRELTRGEGLALLRQSRHYVSQMARGFCTLENWTDARHLESHAWLRWCGFTLDAPQPWGVEKLPFHRFHKDV